MSGDNGKVEEKSEEQLNKERAERFAKDPFSFIEISELICAVMRNPASSLGISIMIGNAKRSEINMAQSELNYKLDMCRRSMDIQAEVEKQGKIVPAKHGILDFAKRRRV